MSQTVSVELTSTTNDEVNRVIVTSGVSVVRKTGPKDAVFLKMLVKIASNLIPCLEQGIHAILDVLRSFTEVTHSQIVETTLCFETATGDKIKFDLTRLRDLVIRSQPLI